MVHSQHLQLLVIVHRERGDVAAAVVEEDAVNGSVMHWSMRHAVSLSDSSHIACWCRCGHVGEDMIDYENISADWKGIAFSRCNRGSSQPAQRGARPSSPTMGKMRHELEVRMELSIKLVRGMGIVESL